jgi:hypothetical protein
MSALVYLADNALTLSRKTAIADLESHRPVGVRFGLDGTEAVLQSYRHELKPAPRVHPVTGRFLPAVRTMRHHTGIHYILTCNGRQEAMRAENWEQALHRAELRCCSVAAGIRQHDECRIARRPI